MEPESRPPSSTPAQPVGSIGPDGAAWTWRYRRDFGPWLRDLRKVARMTLRDAARPLGISFSKLQKLEVGARARPPSLEVIARLAVLFGKELDLMLTRAGFKMEVPLDLRDAIVCDDAFANLMLHPSLRPSAMDERWLEAFSRIQKAQILEFARKLEAHFREGGPIVDELIREARDEDRADDEA